MKLGLSIGYSGAKLRIPIERIKLAEHLGYDSLWTAEAYGSDAITPLAWIAAQTERIRLGTGIMQLAGRSPAMAAMQAQTVDALAGGGRVIAGLGVSGPQIVEGWYGEPWGKPYWRLRDYIQIMRKVNLREDPVTHDGREYQLPFTGDGAMGIGKPLMSIMHTNRELPIWLGSGSEATVKLTAELCDGWLPMHFVPGRMDHYRRGSRRASAGPGQRQVVEGPGDHGPGPVLITDDVKGRHRPGQAVHRPLRRRHGPQGPQLPQPAHGAAGLPRGGRAGAGAVPRPAASRRRSTPSPTNTSTRQASTAR